MFRISSAWAHMALRNWQYIHNEAGPLLEGTPIALEAVESRNVSRTGKFMDCSRHDFNGCHLTVARTPPISIRSMDPYYDTTSHAYMKCTGRKTTLEAVSTAEAEAACADHLGCQSFNWSPHTQQVQFLTSSKWSSLPIISVSYTD